MHVCMVTVIYFQFIGDEEACNTNLLMPKVRKLDSLRDFINSVAQPLVPQVALIIDREKSIMSQVLKEYKNPNFNLQAALNITFHSCGRMEPGVDAGGPTKAFFYLLMQELGRGSFNGIKLFEGEIGHLTPSCDYDLISSCFFKIVGKMILHSVINGCKGIAGISPAVISYIISGNRDSVPEHLVIEDIPDPCLRHTLNEVHLLHFMHCIIFFFFL